MVEELGMTAIYITIEGLCSTYTPGRTDCARRSPRPRGSDDTARLRRTEVGRDRTDVVRTNEGRGLRRVPRVPGGERGRGAAGDGREPRRAGAPADRGRRGRVRRGLVLGLARGGEGLRRRGR